MSLLAFFLQMVIVQRVTVSRFIAEYYIKPRQRRVCRGPAIFSAKFLSTLDSQSVTRIVIYEIILISNTCLTFNFFNFIKLRKCVGFLNSLRLCTSNKECICKTTWSLVGARYLNSQPNAIIEGITLR